MAAGGRSLSGDAACAPQQQGTAERPCSRVRGKDRDTQKWILEVDGSQAAGRWHIQVCDVVVLGLALKSWRAPKMLDVFWLLLIVISGVFC